MKRLDTIQFILTGGTIDSYYKGEIDTAVPNKHSVIPNYLKGLKLYLNLEFTEICMKDSRSLTKQDLKRICKEIERSPCKNIIITHGTYTMPDTARYLKANLKRKDQKIILTGSMIPLKGFEFTDAPFNLGYSIGNLKNIDNGIYLCMNGTIFTPEEVAKNLSEGRFYSVFKEKQ
jgi:L-asparaginase